MVYFDPRELFPTLPQSNDGDSPSINMSLRESIDIILSNSWPYKSVSPIQAYLLGVFGCLGIFVTYVFLSHYIGKMSRRRLLKLRTAAKRRGVSKHISMTKKDRGLSFEKDLRNEECYRSKVNNFRGMDKVDLSISDGSVKSTEIPTRGVANDTAFSQSRQQMNRSDLSRRERYGDNIMKDKTSSYKLYEHMNSFPLETGENERATAENQGTIPSRTLCLLHSGMALQKCDTSDMIEFEPDEAVRAAKNQINDLTSHESAPEVYEDKTNADVCTQNLMITPISSAPGSLRHSTCPTEISRESSDSNNEKDSIARPSLVHDTKHYVKIASSSKDTSISQADEQHVSSSHTSSNVNISSCHRYGAQIGSAEVVSQTSPANIVATENSSKTSNFIVLVSTGVADCAQAANQKATLNLFDDLDISYKVIDGMNPSKRSERNMLFEISGIHGNYPQVFINEKGHHRYLGGYEWLELQSIDELHKIHARSQRKPLNTPRHGKSERRSSDSSPSCVHPMRGYLTLLISNGVADYIQAANQKSAMLLLTDFGIPYEMVDGMNPLQREKRDELFKISGIRGNYPQLFVFDETNGQNRYLGNFDWLEVQKANDLRAILSETAVVNE